MLKRNIGGILAIIGFVLGLGGIIIAGINGGLNAVSGVMFVVCVVFCVIGYILLRSTDSTEQERQAKNFALKLKGKIDYKNELEQTRAKFASSTEANKNRIKVRAVGQGKKLYQFEVVDEGKMVYGTLVEANSELFKKAKSGIEEDGIMPGVAVFSLDEYYEEHPDELRGIADALFADKRNNSLRSDFKYVFNEKVPKRLTGGRTVYMSTLAFYRKFLPVGFLTGWLFPVFALPEKYDSLILVDCKYWTDNLIADFVHVNFDDDEECDEDSEHLFSELNGDAHIDNNQE